MPLYSANLLAGRPLKGVIMPATARGDNAMPRYAFIAAMLLALLPSAPSFAVTEKQKMVTCKFGADDQKLAGAARAKFLKNCMANRDDPRGPPAGANVPAPSAGMAPPPAPTGPSVPPPPRQ
jgi:hypothetical protein